MKRTKSKKSKRTKEQIIGNSYQPTLLRNPPKKGTIKQKAAVWYVGGKLKKNGELGEFYKGPFVNEIMALECVGEVDWYIIKVTEKGKYKMKWYWRGFKWYRYD